jgi:hypothetical protein
MKSVPPQSVSFGPTFSFRKEQVKSNGGRGTEQTKNVSFGSTFSFRKEKVEE